MTQHLCRTSSTKQIFQDDGFFYDLILLDIEMPGISGMEIPQQLKGFLPNVRIIFVTSHTEYAIDAFELSIFRYVPKNNLEVKLAAAVNDAAKLIELEAGQEYTIQTASRMEKIPYKDIFYIAIYSGMRVSEILALQGKDIDLEKRTININKTLTKDQNSKTVLGKTTKTYAGTREIPFIDVLYPILEKYTKSNFLFLHDGNFIGHNTINSHFKKICKDAKIQISLPA